ncbi:MAG: glucose 1-dehydrogenase [Acidimicrobiia bacterium]|jgi:7-alpha-hydroxysteroid dehydrogenase
MGILEQFLLTDRVAIVTGAGRGIGAAIATVYAQAGADVVLTARTESALTDVAERVRTHGRRALVVPGDVNDLAFLATLVDRTVTELGRVDLVVNNAGGSTSQPTLDTDSRKLEASFHFNVSAPLELVRLAVPHMLDRDGGAVVNIGSVAGTNANRGSLTHSVTKAALAQMTRVMASDLAPRVRVNAVLPGAIETEALRWWLDEKGADARAAMVQNTPMRRNGTPEDIAAAVLYLSSPAAAWVTGKLLEVDGGALGAVLPSPLPDL